MGRRGITAALTFGSMLLAISGCARYQPSPLDPPSHATAVRARRMDDPTLRAWVERFGGPLTPGRWNDRQLAVAALAHRADLERVRREWLAARAAGVAAGARPAPGVEGGLERAVGGRDEGTPWVVSLAGLFTIELGGKRAARMQAARAREAAAEAELAHAAAATVGRVRETALAVRHAGESRDRAVASLEALRRVESLERGRFAEAALSSGELARTAADVAAAQADAAAREGELRMARAALAAALAVGPDQVSAMRLEPGAQPGCSWAETIGPDSLAGLTMIRRPELAQALARYAAAEADVRARVAASHPDLELGPGFIWDQGVHRWTLAAALPALLGVRARGPITAAEADRHAAAARVAEVQDALFAEAGAALESCRGAAVERGVADSLRVAADRVAALAQAAYDRGETGRLELARAELLQVRALTAERAAARRLERAGLELELAAAQWIGAEAASWPDRHVEPFTPPEEAR
jgi:cobalt-zinc-cadmium efflux system outer membrane protein